MAPPAFFGPYGSAAVEYIQQFERYGANALWFHGFDPMPFEACQKHNIAACVEFKTFRADFNKHPELVPIGIDGKPIRYGDLVQGVCLSKKDFLEETEAALIDGLAKYQPAGIWLDYLTYAGWFETPEPDLQESCFCPDCIADFCNATGLDITSPGEILSSAHEAWKRRKCERVAGLAARYADLIRTALPGCVTGAYMCPWLPDEFDGALSRIFAQDYDLLSPAIDIFTPLIYCTKSGREHAWGRRFLQVSPEFVPSGHPVQLILDMLEFPGSLVETAQAIPPSQGVQVYGGARIFADAEMGKVFARVVEEIQKNLRN